MGSELRRRPSPAVYRRRRLVVLLLALIVIGAVAWLLIAQPWQALAASQADAEPSAAPTTSTPTPTSNPTPTPTPTSTVPPTPQPCDPSVIELVPLVSGEKFASRPVEMRIRLTNTGSVDCTMDVGTSQQRFVVTSGKDTWWRSTDCQSEPSSLVVTLAAGQTVESAEPLVWDRTRSDVSTCDSETRPRAPGGGAAYHLQVEVGDVKSKETAQFFLL
ncbi:hypothetical protein B5M43_012355 [Microbacterium sp. MEC084]|uniref:hypothetical protein n=1 Tax=Microbacterium sp. MEC084 TaxID=1963027 RepID=UPI0010704BBE|nr:hypothetical protein [Microbacterium sp. MEC084]MCD1269616.1 hypothetical protein [Microbacterium sp. MEC084]